MWYLTFVEPHSTTLTCAHVSHWNTLAYQSCLYPLVMISVIDFSWTAHLSLYITGTHASNLSNYLEDKLRPPGVGVHAANHFRFP